MPHRHSYLDPELIRAYFASPYNLGEYIPADYIKNQRRRVR